MLACQNFVKALAASGCSVAAGPANYFARSTVIRYFCRFSLIPPDRRHHLGAVARLVERYRSSRCIALFGAGGLNQTFTMLSETILS
jgi:hypothetical protein